MNIKIFLRFSKDNSFTIILILLMVFSRLIPHPPNFTPIVAVAIMSSFFFKNLSFSILVMITSMLLSDLFIGFYTNIVFVYLPLILINYLFFYISHKLNFKSLFLYGFTGALVFYLISNFGVWYNGNMYEKNLYGLMNCYYFAIPFFKNTLLSTLFFSYLTLWIYSLRNKKIVN